MKKQKLKFNYLIASFVSMLNVGIIRKLRFIKIVKLNIFLRLLRILYKYGVIRAFFIKDDHVHVHAPIIAYMDLFVPA